MLGAATKIVNLCSSASTVFGQMLKSGNPPDDWDAQLNAARGEKLPL